MKIYLAGPMRGYPAYNFPAFDAAAADLRSRGHTVISPAEMDREVGFDPYVSTPDHDFLEMAMRRDVEAIMSVDAVVLLPGWERSTGATAEMHLAKWRHIEILTYPDLEQPKEDICEEAMRITRGDRQAQYGPPDQDFARTAKMWSALKGVEFSPADVAMFMICLKLSREIHQKKRDNRVDGVGYFRCLEICREAEANAGKT